MIRTRHSAAPDDTIMLDELATARIRQAHVFVASALVGKSSSGREFAKTEQAEQAITEGLLYHQRFRLNSDSRALSHLIDPDTVTYLSALRVVTSLFR